MTNIKTRTTAIIVAIMVAMTFMPTVANAAEKDAYNIHVSKATAGTVTFKWKGNSKKGWVVYYKSINKKYKKAYKARNQMVFKTSPGNKKHIVKFKVARKGTKKFSYLVTGVNTNHKKRNVWKVKRVGSGKVTLKAGASKKLKVKLVGQKKGKLVSKKVVWTSSNKSVATVSKGKVKAKKAGTAVITARAHSGRKTTYTIKVKAPAKGGVDYKTVHKVSSPTQIAKKGTYQFTNPLTGRTDTVKVEDVENTSQRKRIQGTTNNIPYYLAIRNGEVTLYSYGKTVTKDYRCGGVINSNGAHGYETQAKNKNTTIKWTCDGTDPANVTGDKWGHCEYTKEWVESVPYGNPKPRDQKKWDEKYKHEDGYWKYLDTYLQGTTTYGKYRIICDNSETASYRRVFWVKVYKNGKMIFEEYRVIYPR